MNQWIRPNTAATEQGGKEGQAVTNGHFPKLSRLAAVWEHVPDLRTAATGSQNSLNDWERIKIMLMEKQRKQRLIQHREPSHKHASYPFTYLA